MDFRSAASLIHSPAQAVRVAAFQCFPQNGLLVLKPAQYLL
jgi:hypothetical protein